MIFGGTVEHFGEFVGHCDMTKTTVIGIVSHGAGREEQRDIMIEDIMIVFGQCCMVWVRLAFLWDSGALL